MSGADPVTVEQYRVPPGSTPRLAQRGTKDDLGFGKQEGKRRLAEAVARIDALQQKLWAERRWAVLLILQGLDTSGKDGAIRHVLSGVNPQGVQVNSFVAPNNTERQHDFLWRVHKVAPPRGVLGVFNRSHYEEVIVPRLRPDVLEGQHLPKQLTADGPDPLFRRRLEDIAAFERYLARQGTAILKVFLHLSREEQRERLLARLDDPSKTWKFDPSDVEAHQEYDATLAAYEDALAVTAIPDAPWYVFPADRKWHARLLVAEALVQTLETLDLAPPEPDAKQQAALGKAKEELAAERRPAEPQAERPAGHHRRH